MNLYDHKAWQKICLTQIIRSSLVVLKFSNPHDLLWVCPVFQKMLSKFSLRFNNLLIYHLTDWLFRQPTLTAGQPKWHGWEAEGLASFFFLRVQPWFRQNPYKSFMCMKHPSLDTWGLFLESPETFRPYFGRHNSLCIFKTKALRGTKLCSYFHFYSLCNIIMKRPALQNKQVVLYQMAFRARKVLGTFKKRAPGNIMWIQEILHFKSIPFVSSVVYLSWCWCFHLVFVLTKLVTSDWKQPVSCSSPWPFCHVFKKAEIQIYLMHEAVCRVLEQTYKHPL